MLRAIAFDLWETLITDTPDLSREQERLRLSRMEEILRGRGYGAVSDRIEHAYRALWHRCQALYWSEDLDIPCRRQIEHLLEELELEPATFDENVLAELEHAYAHAALEVLPAVVDGALETLAALKARGFGVGLISNTGRTPGYALREILGNLDLAPSIDAMVFSDEHGFCKPRPSIFEQLRTQLDVDYNEMLFVGDNLYVDILGAKRCGMKTVHFVPPVRGTAVAPAVEHEEVEADATVTRLRDLLTLVERMKDEG
jgi:putative hydrolase of the HAD superfamily